MMTGQTASILFVSGLLTAGYLVAALFFLRFWRGTRDRLFAFFAAAFGLLALQRVALAAALVTGHSTTEYYLLRLAAFVLILIAIVQKNRAARERP
jgi:hypothetical protein